ncbi:MAG: tetratricopeptide repeat protein [Betaproteobacteria bacterium]|nr:tetratricopeptide repeat protein [Betaproteobacteria bacterium]
MGERRGNRFYPHANLSDSGTFNPEIRKLRETTGQGIARGNLSVVEIKAALRCCELLYWKGDWAQVQDLASQVIATGCGYRATFRLYRFWMEALRSEYNFSGLKWVGRHLLSLRHSSAQFLPLAAMALAYTGERRFSALILKSMNAKSVRKSITHVEAFAVYCAESPRRDRREKGLQYLQALNVNNKANYFLARNYLVYSLENDYLEEASRAFELIHDRFPRCPEPYWGAARLAVAHGHWSEAVRVLQELVADHPDNTDALIALASCMEKTGDLLAARDILTSSRELFEENDYDFSATLGTLNKSLYARYGMDEYRDEAIRSFAQAVASAQKLGLSEASLHVALSELGAQKHFAEKRSVKARDLSSSDKTLQTPSPRAWILSLDDNDVGHLKKHSTLLMRSPGTVRKGDLVLVARRFGSNDWREGQQQIVGVMGALSDVTPDARYGYAVCVGRFQELETPLDLQLGRETTAMLDFYGCENFSAQSPVFFLDADPKTSEEVVRAVERSLRLVRPFEADQHAV